MKAREPEYRCGWAESSALQYIIRLHPAPSFFPALRLVYRLAVPSLVITSSCTVPDQFQPSPWQSVGVGLVASVWCYRSGCKRLTQKTVGTIHQAARPRAALQLDQETAYLAACQRVVLYISLSGAAHRLVRGAVHRTPQRHLRKASVCPAQG